MKTAHTRCQDWYEHEYHKQGFDAQRRYPNEELLRFFGRELFSIPYSQRKRIKILEIGCGSCANLWMIAHEGFQAFGIDISKKSLKLGQQMLKKWGVKAILKCASMMEIPFAVNYFDVVIDVFSANCLSIHDFKICAKEVHRVLKPKGVFFSYTPSVNSDAFRNYYPTRKIDDYTLDGIRRKSSPYYGNFYPFRFSDAALYRSWLGNGIFNLVYQEFVSRTYRATKEYFEFLVTEAIKK